MVKPIGISCCRDRTFSGVNRELLVSGRVAVQLTTLDDEVIYHIAFHTFTLGILAHSPSENVFMEPKFTMRFGGDEGRPNHPLTSHSNPKQPPGMYETL